MSSHTLIATAAFGHESIVAHELTALGYTDLTIENGRVIFAGEDRDIARCNLWLRCADRLLLRMAEFPAKDFEELFQGTLRIPWEEFIPENGRMYVTGKSIRSQLFSVPDCQSIVKKGVVEAMKRRYPRGWFTEDGPEYKIEVALLKDIVTITVDTSGPGLHKRGYRLESGEAPLRETLAAAILSLSRWTPERLLADPLCGSGTIAIEAALIGRNIAPGLKRRFAAEEWPSLPRAVWDAEREQATAAIRPTSPVILASDNNYHVFKVARENAERARVADCIVYQKKPLEEFSSKKKYGVVVTNPPYGERMGDAASVAALYRELGRIRAELDTWSFFILSANEDFEADFGGKADRNRKLYNGKLKTYLYQYLGPLPPRGRSGGRKEDA